MSKIWEVRSEIIFPKAQIAKGKDGGLPKKLKFVSRYIEDSIIEIEEAKLFLKKWEGEPTPGNNNIQGVICESVMLVCSLSGNDGFAAMEKAMQYIEWACDQLSFYAQFPVTIVSSQLVSLDDETEKYIFPFPKQSAKFRSSRYGNTRGSVMIPLVPTPKHFTERDLAALRWYHKSLAATYEVDRFVFLWVCLEISCKIAGDSVKAHYIGSCGHVIESCPHCGKSTEREVNGKTLQSFLAEKLNVDKDSAKKLWRFRQLLHGQNKLTEESSKEMENLIMILKSAICLALKRRFGFKDQDPPIVLSSGPVVSAMYLKIKPKENA